MKKKMEEKYIKRRTVVGLLIVQAVTLFYSYFFAECIYWLIK